METCSLCNHWKIDVKNQCFNAVICILIPIWYSMSYLGAFFVSIGVITLANSVVITANGLCCMHQPPKPVQKEELKPVILQPISEKWARAYMYE
jgi:hypothetical protein